MFFLGKCFKLVCLINRISTVDANKKKQLITIKYVMIFLENSFNMMICYRKIVVKCKSNKLHFNLKNKEAIITLKIGKIILGCEVRFLEVLKLNNYFG